MEENGKKRAETAKNKQTNKPKHTAREASRAVDWEGERAVIFSFSGLEGSSGLTHYFVGRGAGFLSLSPVTFAIRKLEEDIAVLFKTPCSTVF